MAGFRLDEKRVEPRPDRRLGIRLEDPSTKRALGGKLDAYVPPELLYDYKPPSVFAQYRVLTAVFVAVGLGLLISWAVVSSHANHAPQPAQVTPAPATVAPAAPNDQPIYIQPLQTH